MEHQSSRPAKPYRYPTKILLNVHAFASVLIATVAAHLVGSAILFGVVSGPTAMIASPLLAIFGWFFIPLESLVATAQWMLVSRGASRPITVAWLATVPLSMLVMVAAGPSEHGNEFVWRWAYGLATAVAASVSLAIITTSQQMAGTMSAATDSGEPCDEPKSRSRRF